MDERVKRLERLFSEYIDLADGIHADPEAADERYDALRTRLSRWHLAVDNVAWLASLDMGEVQGRWDNRVRPGPQIRACLAAWNWMIREKRLRMDAEDMEDLTVAANPDLTNMIWRNLIDNAIRFTDAGGCITIRVGRDGKYALIAFMDSGAGIREADLPRVFDRYAQFGDAERGEGLGLGLAVVREAALALGGDVACASAPGIGATVRVRLPIAEEPEG